MEKLFVIEKEGEQYELSECVEMCALRIAESVLKNQKGAEEIMQDCNILNALSNALLAVRK